MDLFIVEDRMTLFAVCSEARYVSAKGLLPLRLISFALIVLEETGWVVMLVGAEAGRG